MREGEGKNGKQIKSGRNEKKTEQKYTHINFCFMDNSLILIN